MALKSGRVGVRNDQVDVYGKIKVTVPTDLTVETLNAKRLSIKANNNSRYIDANPTNKTTSFYGAVKIGSSETPTNLEINGDATINGDTTSENLFASDEIEFSDENGDFGTNAKVKINNAIDELDVAKLDVGSGNLGKVLSVASTGAMWTNSSVQQYMPYLTSAPTEDNPNGLKFVVLTSEPDTKYNGYVYFIMEA